MTKYINGNTSNNATLNDTNNSEENKLLWNETVDGQSLFEELVSTFNKYLSLEEYQAEALSLWAIFSHSYDANNISPRLLITSPEKRCGKTTLIDVLMGLVNEPLNASNITPAAMFRAIEHYGGTVMLDEADTFIKNNQEINGIINSGHRKSQASVIRCEGEKHIPRKFSTWSPCVIAMIQKPTDTIIDRSIIIEMKRKKQNDRIERFSPSKSEEELAILKKKIVRWVSDNYESLKDSNPFVSLEINDRAQDNWRPLMAIATRLGSDVLDIATNASLKLSQSGIDEEDSPAILLLSDIQEIFLTTRELKITTEALLDNLNEIEDRPWAEWNKGRPITARQIATKLKPFGIKPRKLRIGSHTANGYELKYCEDSFDRYLNGTVPYNVPDKEGFNPLKNKDCSTVPDKTWKHLSSNIFDE